MVLVPWIAISDATNSNWQSFDIECAIIVLFGLIILLVYIGKFHRAVDLAVLASTAALAGFVISSKADNAAAMLMSTAFYLSIPIAFASLVGYSFFHPMFSGCVAIIGIFVVLPIRFNGQLGRAASGDFPGEVCLLVIVLVCALETMKIARSAIKDVERRAESERSLNEKITGRYQWSMRDSERIATKARGLVNRERVSFPAVFRVLAQSGLARKGE